MTILTAFILTIVVSSIGYYVFAVEPTTPPIPTEPSFTLKVKQVKDAYAPKDYIEIKCTLNISEFQTNKSFEKFENFKMLFNSPKIIPKSTAAKPGEITNCEWDISAFHKGTKVDSSGLPVWVFEQYEYEFNIVLKVDDLGKDSLGNSITSMEITKDIFKGAKITFEHEGAKSYSIDFTDDMTKDFGVTVKEGADHVPDISAKFISANPTESVLDEEVTVKYQINANEFKPPVINIAGRETIIVLENSQQNVTTSGYTAILNGTVNEIINGKNGKPDDKLALITCATGLSTGKVGEVGDGGVYTFKVTPNKPEHITPEDIQVADVSNPSNPKLQYNHDLVSRNLFEEFTNQNINNQAVGTVNLNGVAYGHVDYKGLDLTKPWTSKKRNIVGGFTAALELLKAKGDPTCSKNIVFIGSGLITPEEKAAIQNFNLKENNINLFTVQVQPLWLNGGPNGVYNTDLSMEDLDKSFGSGDKSFYRNYASNNDLQIDLMGMLSKKIANSSPALYSFDEFTLRFDLGENFGLFNQDNLAATDDENKIKEIKVTDYKLRTKQNSEGIYVPKWYKKGPDGEVLKDKDGKDIEVSPEEITIEFPVYPKVVSPPIKVPLTFKPNGSTISYTDIYGKLVTGLIEQPQIVVVDPADPRTHGLDNGLDVDGNISIVAGSGSISGATNATLLAYAQILAQDVSITLTIDPTLMTGITHYPHLYYFRDGGYVDSGVIINEPINITKDGITKKVYKVDSMPVKLDLSPGKPDPKGWVRGDIVVLKYTVMVPPWDTTKLQAVEYKNSVEYFRAVKGLKPFKEAEDFDLSSADLPDLF